MLYTLGYAGIKPPFVLKACTKLDAQLWDVRSSPRSRVPGFNKGSLVTLLGPRYSWHPELGGRERDWTEGLVRLRRALETKNIILMCMEKDPERCHRKSLAQHSGAQWWHILPGTKVWQKIEG